MGTYVRKSNLSRFEYTGLNRSTTFAFPPFPMYLRCLVLCVLKLLNNARKPQQQIFEGWLADVWRCGLFGRAAVRATRKNFAPARVFLRTVRFFPIKGELSYSDFGEWKTRGAHVYEIPREVVGKYLWTIWLILTNSRRAKNLESKAFTELAGSLESGGRWNFLNQLPRLAKNVGNLKKKRETNTSGVSDDLSRSRKIKTESSLNPGVITGLSIFYIQLRGRETR